MKCGDDLTRLTGSAGYIKHSKMTKWREKRGRKSKPIVSVPGKIHQCFKAGIARLASEYERIKSTL